MANNNNNNNKNNNKKSFELDHNSSNPEWWEYLIPGWGTYRSLQYLSSLIAPANISVKDLIARKTFVPLRRSLGSATPNNTVFTNRNFTEGFNSLVDSIVQAQADKRYPNWRSDIEHGDTIRFHIDGHDYHPEYGWVNKTKPQSPWEKITTPLGQLEHTLGSFDAEIYKDGMTITDPGGYDFDDVSVDGIGKVADYKSKKDYYDALIQAALTGKTGPYGIYRSLESVHGTPSSAPTNEKFKFKLKYKRKK